MAKRTGYWDLRKFANSLRALAEGLPTSEDKAALRRHFEEIISFLSQAQQAIDSLPTSDEAAGVRRAVDAFEQLAEQAKSRPVLSAALGLKPPTAPRPKLSGLTQIENERAQALLNELRALSIDGMNARLRDDPSIGARDLEAVASLVGIRPKRRAGREMLVEQIVTKISNYRGYRELQGRSS
jgi:hypothetical protein